jgi:dTDP-4-dehydrorhamnose reductase
MTKAIAAGQTVRAFSDRIVSPTSVRDAAAATLALIENEVTPGLYHCVNSGSGSWLELAEHLADALGMRAHLIGIRCRDVVLPAPRPRYCALSNDKLRAAGIELPHWQDALAAMLADYRNTASGGGLRSPLSLQCGIE